MTWNENLSFRKILIDACRNGKEVVLESANDALGNVAAMHVWRPELVGYFPLLFDIMPILRSHFIVEDLKIYPVTAIDETLHDDYLGSNAVLTFFNLERAHKNGVGVTMVGSHDVLIPTA